MKLSPDDAAASSVPPRADEGPAAPSFPGTPGRERPEDAPMPQQPPAVHDETARLGDGLVSGPPPTGVPPVHAQSARRGQPAAPVPADQPPATRAPADGTLVDETRADESPAEALPAEEASAADREWDDTRPVSREWMTAGTRDAVDDEPADDAPADNAPAEQSPAGHDTAEPVTEHDAATGDGEARTAGDTVVLDDSERPAVPDAPVADDEAGKGPGGPVRPAGPRRPWWRSPAAIAAAAAVAVLGGAYGVDLLLSSGEIPRHTVVAGVDLGGLSPADAAPTLERELAPRLTAEHTLVADDVTAPLSPAVAGIALDVDATVDAAADQSLAPWTRLATLFTDRAVDPVLDVDRTALDGRLEEFAGQVDRAPVEATIAFAGTTPSLVQPADGRSLDRD